MDKSVLRATGATKQQPTRRHRWFRIRYGLRTFFAICVVLGIAFGCLGMLYNDVRQQRSARAAITRLGANAYQMDRYSFRAPDWLLQVLGQDLFFTVFKVEIDNPRLSDKTLAEISQHLVRFPDLQIVNIHNAAISDFGLQALTSLPPRVNLGIHFCPISDGGLKYLEHFNRSQEMWLIGTNITETGAAQLARAVTNCTIMFDSDGRIDWAQEMDHMRRRGPYHGPGAL